VNWEYKILNASGLVMALGVGDAEAELTGLLNDLGAEGWEVFNGPQAGWFFLKRPRAAGA
jgi:hypothetical protein